MSGARAGSRFPLAPVVQRVGTAVAAASAMVCAAGAAGWVRSDFVHDHLGYGYRSTGLWFESAGGELCAIVAHADRGRGVFHHSADGPGRPALSSRNPSNGLVGPKLLRAFANTAGAQGVWAASDVVVRMFHIRVRSDGLTLPPLTFAASAPSAEVTVDALALPYWVVCLASSAAPILWIGAAYRRSSGRATEVGD